MSELSTANEEEVAARRTDWTACEKASRWDGEVAKRDGRMSGWMSHMMSARLILLLLANMVT